MTKVPRAEAPGIRVGSAPGADGRLLGATVAIFELMGAEVRLDPTCDDNFVRRGRADEAPFVACAEGLANLVHELGHVLWFGALEDDHGIDYRAIPYRMDEASGSSILVQELACSVLSCAYLPTDTPAEAVDAWFAEQIEIQPVFYGFAEADAVGFAGAVDAWLARGQTRAELEQAVITLQRRAARWLAGLGARSTVRGDLRFDALWLRYRSRSAR